MGKLQRSEGWEIFDKFQGFQAFYFICVDEKHGGISRASDLLPALCWMSQEQATANSIIASCRV